MVEPVVTMSSTSTRDAHPEHRDASSRMCPTSLPEREEAVPITDLPTAPRNDNAAHTLACTPAPRREPTNSRTMSRVCHRPRDRMDRAEEGAGTNPTGAFSSMPHRTSNALRQSAKGRSHS